MKKSFINIVNIEEQDFPEIQTRFSLEPYLVFLKNQLKKEEKLRKSFLQEILKQIQEKLAQHGPVNSENKGHFAEIFEMIYSTLNPLITNTPPDGGLGLPMGHGVFFGTEGFYKLLNGKDCYTQVSIQSPTGFGQKQSNEILSMFYAFVLERLYGLSSTWQFDLIHTTKETSGLNKFYKIQIDPTFVNINIKGALPSLEHLRLQDEFMKSLDVKLLKELLPIEQFQMEGFSILRVLDVTKQQSLENLKSLIIEGGDPIKPPYLKVFDNLRNLAGEPDVNFSLTPFLKLNGQVVFEQQEGYEAFLLGLVKEKGIDLEEIMDLFQGFLHEPSLLVYVKGDQTHSEVMAYFLDELLKRDIEGYALLPLFHKLEMVGVLEVFTDEKGVWSEQVLVNLFSASSLLAQLLKDEALNFETRINEVIKDKFTSLQTAVQWKFNEKAWKFLLECKGNKQNPRIEDIKFEEVYPLYGAIDIRSSTVERNMAAFQDYFTHLKRVESLLIEFNKHDSLPIVEEMLFNCRQWLTEINEEVMDHYQFRLNEFFNLEVRDIISHFKESSPETRALIEEYERAIDPVHGVVHIHRNALENSIQMINNGINGYLEFFNKELQNSYPCYFEKFRSDGVEYDIYIGQSIAPQKKFNEVFLKNIRLWQVTSMAGIARITHSLLEQMEKKLYTTQLIYVNSFPIDICFRTDERRFDVEGAYNIRYQVIKKRIDKVTIMNTNERLTQPGKIAIVYFTENDANEYRSYISYLQKNGTLLDDMEELMLEELQGVKGLKALRVGVRFN